MELYDPAAPQQANALTVVQVILRQSLTVRIQAIDGTGTFTLLDSQPCRLLTSLPRVFPEFLATTSRSVPVPRIDTLVLGVPPLDVSLAIEATGSHVPHKGLGQSHATSMPDVTQASCRLSLGWSRANDSSRFRHRPYAFDTYTVVHDCSSLCPIPDAVMPRRFS